jgi:type II secretory pathway component PulF
MATKLDILYAKLIFRTSTEKRMNAYRKIASLLRNDFTLTEALERLWQIESKDGKNKNEPFAIAFREMQNMLERGGSFFDAVKGWSPDVESLMLSVGDISKLSIALENTVRVCEGTAKIKHALTSAIAYPLFLFIMTFIIIIMVGVYLLPPMLDAAGKDIIWNGAARNLVEISELFGNNWAHISLAGAAILLAIYFSMPRLTGWMRSKLDKVAPWSLYKIFVSSGWLVSLASLIRAGATLPEALKLLSDNSNRYLRKISDKTLDNIIRGYNLGDALEQAHSNFPNAEIIGDLKIYADMDEFDKNLMNVANEYMNDSIRHIENISNTLNSIGMLLISVVIGWVVFGTFEMQDQIAIAIA